MFTNSNFTFRDERLKWFSALWSIVIIAPLVYFPAPAVLTGHPWKVELVASFLLSAILAVGLLARRKADRDFSISPQIFRFVAAPCGGLIIWSALSAFWAGSLASVAHHTLLWTCYLTFFLFAVRVARDKRFFKRSVVALGAVVTVVGLCCILEFVFEETIGETFGTRYGRYAEIFAALLPLFFSYVLRLKRKNLRLTIFATACLWLGLLFALSRGSLFSAVAGLSVFIFLRIISRPNAAEKKRLAFAVAGLICTALLTQSGIFSGFGGAQKGDTFSRLAISEEKDQNNTFAGNVRFLFAGVAKEMFTGNPVAGVGADNFGLEFNKYRAVFSASPKNNLTAQQAEDTLPERAHNEYLQILTELGVVGAALFLWFLCGIARAGFAEIAENRFARSGILTHAAIAGIAAFLVSSCFSSFSFRLMQNGLVFFFLLAILVRNLACQENREKNGNLLALPGLKLLFASGAVAACLSLTIFSALKATSQYFVYEAEKQENFGAAKYDYETAIQLDSANASADFSYGLRLLGEGKYPESAAQLRQSVDKGINHSTAYSYLITAQTLSSQPRAAVATAARAVEIFPFSVFMRARYAALLGASGDRDESEIQAEIARQINKRHAETWRMLIENGALRASREARINKEFAGLDELVPDSGIYAVLAEREIVYPNEKTKFKF